MPTRAELTNLGYKSINVLYSKTGKIFKVGRDFKGLLRFATSETLDLYSGATVTGWTGTWKKDGQDDIVLKYIHKNNTPEVGKSTDGCYKTVGAGAETKVYERITGNAGTWYASTMTMPDGYTFTQSTYNKIEFGNLIFVELIPENIKIKALVSINQSFVGRSNRDII